MGKTKMTKARTRGGKRAALRIARSRRSAQDDALRAIGRDAECRAREPRSRPDADAREAVLAARRRRIGSPKGDISLPLYGSEAGIVIDALAVDLDEALALWAIWNAIDRAHALYTSRVVGVHRSPAAGRVEMLAERVETAPDSPPPDSRTDDERHRAAAADWSRWRARLSRLPRIQRDAITASVWALRPIRRGVRVTAEGVRMVEGMRALREELDRGC